MNLLDSNILIRYLTNDHPKLASRCEALFQRVAGGKEKVLLNHLVIAEVVWVLQAQYHYPAEKIFDLILKIINTPNIEIVDEDIMITALSFWHHAEFKVDYIDAYNAAWVDVKKMKAIYSYDHDFDKLGIQRLEP